MIEGNIKKTLQFRSDIAQSQFQILTSAQSQFQILNFGSSSQKTCKNRYQKAFTVTYWWLFDRTTFSQSNEHFFEKLNHRWKYREQKQNFKLIMVIIFYTDPIDHNLNET